MKKDILEMFNNSDPSSHIEGIALGLYGGEPGALAAVGDYFIVFKKGDLLDSTIHCDISTLPDFLGNPENKLSDKMKKEVADFAIEKLGERQPQKAEGVAVGFLESVLRGVRTVASTVLGPFGFVGNQPPQLSAGGTTAASSHQSQNLRQLGGTPTNEPSSNPESPPLLLPYPPGVTLLRSGNKPQKPSRSPSRPRG